MRRLICLFSVILVLCLANIAMGGWTTNWNGSVSDDYDTDGNWTPDPFGTPGVIYASMVPEGSQGTPFVGAPYDAHECQALIDNWVGPVGIDGEPGYAAGHFVPFNDPNYWPVLSSVVSEIRELKVAHDAAGMPSGPNAFYNGELTVSDGAFLYMDGDLEVGKAGTGILNITGGFLKVGDDCRINSGGTLNLSGGTLDAYGAEGLQMDRGDGATVNISGGLLDAREIEWNSGYTNSIITLSEAGTIKLLNNTEDELVGRIDSGQIVIDGGYPARLFYDSGENKTTLASSYSVFNPYPYDTERLTPQTLTITWVLPDPNGVVTCEVYLGLDPDVMANPRVVDGNDVATTSIVDFDLVGGLQYYWKIRAYDSAVNGGTTPTVVSRTFTFDSLNMLPIVNAGADTSTWVDKVHSLADATLVDPDAPMFMPVEATWTLVDADNDPCTPEIRDVVISDPCIINPTVTFGAVGTYELMLEGDDGDPIVPTDTIIIEVYIDACTHAHNQPGFVTLVGDTDDDCDVDEDDLKRVGDTWLEEDHTVE